MRIKKGDNVVVIKGKDFGQRAKVLKVLSTTAQVVVEGVNLRKRRTKPRRAGEKGQVVNLPQPLAIANIMLWCASCGRGRRFGQMIGKDGKKYRVCRKCGREI